jgi:hypothetical protein
MTAFWSPTAPPESNKQTARNGFQLGRLQNSTRPRVALGLEARGQLQVGGKTSRDNAHSGRRRPTPRLVVTDLPDRLPVTPLDGRCNGLRAKSAMKKQPGENLPPDHDQRWTQFIPEDPCHGRFSATGHRGEGDVAMAALTLAFVGLKSTLGPFWAQATSFLSGTAAAGGIAWINSVGNLGGFVGPTLVGRIEDATGSNVAALLVLGSAMLAMGLLAAMGMRSSGIVRE